MFSTFAEIEHEMLRDIFNALARCNGFDTKNPVILENVNKI
jgi:hypothetical protein